MIPDEVKCCSSRTFDQTVGTFNELQKYLQGYVATLDRDDKKRFAGYVQTQRHQRMKVVPSDVVLVLSC